MLDRPLQAFTLRLDIAGKCIYFNKNAETVEPVTSQEVHTGSMSNIVRTYESVVCASSFFEIRITRVRSENIKLNEDIL